MTLGGAPPGGAVMMPMGPAAGVPGGGAMAPGGSVGVMGTNPFLVGSTGNRVSPATILSPFVLSWLTVFPSI